MILFRFFGPPPTHPPGDPHSHPLGDPGQQQHPHPPGGPHHHPRVPDRAAAGGWEGGVAMNFPPSPLWSLAAASTIGSGGEKTEEEETTADYKNNLLRKKKQKKVFFFVVKDGGAHAEAFRKGVAGLKALKAELWRRELRSLSRCHADPKTPLCYSLRGASKKTPDTNARPQPPGHRTSLPEGPSTDSEKPFQSAAAQGYVFCIFYIKKPKPKKKPKKKTIYLSPPKLFFQTKHMAITSLGFAHKIKAELRPKNTQGDKKNTG